MPNQLVTRWPGGFTNSGPGSVAGDLKIGKPWTYFQQFSDFGEFTPTNWVVTGGASQTITAEANGVLTLVNGAGAATENGIQWAGGSGAVKPLFQHAATKDLLAFFRLSLDDVDLTGLLVGLAIADTTPIADVPASGMFAFKSPTSLFVNGYARQAGVGSNTNQTQIPMVDNAMTWIAMQYIAAEGACRLYINDAAFRVPAPLTMPTALLAPIIAFSNGSAAARTVKVDTYFAASER